MKVVDLVWTFLRVFMMVPLFRRDPQYLYRREILSLVCLFELHAKRNHFFGTPEWVECTDIPLFFPGPGENALGY